MPEALSPTYTGTLAPELRANTRRGSKPIRAAVAKAEREETTEHEPSSNGRAFNIDYDTEILNHLPDPDAWETLREEKFTDDLIRDPEVRSIYEWAECHLIGHGKPPTATVLRDEFPDLELREPETAIGDLIARIRDRYMKNQGRDALKEIGDTYLNDPARVPHKMREVLHEFDANGIGRRRNKFAKPTRAAELVSVDIDWLWASFLPLGALSLLYGHEGEGKSVLAAMIAAQATRGLLPGAFKREPVGVEFVAYEDDPAAVIKPRLEAAGADLDLVYFHESDGDNELTLPDDAEAFGEAVAERGSRLIIIDPLPDALREDLKDNNNRETRAALVPLQQMAQDIGACVLGITHPNKSSGSTTNRVMGSKAYRSVPRSVLLYGPNPDEPEDESQRILALSKSNYARKVSLKVHVDEVPVDGLRSSHPRAKVLGMSDFTDTDVIGGWSGAAPDKSKKAEAESIIVQLLEDGGGEVEAKVAYEAGEVAGISEPLMRKARQALEVNVSGRVWNIPEEAS
jgi:hypothetical protein